MPKKDSQTEINKRHRESIIEEEIMKDYQRYREEQIKLGMNDSKELPFCYSFAMNNTQNGLYKGV